MFKEELEKASSLCKASVKEDTPLLNESNEEITQSFDNGSADLFAMLDALPVSENENSQSLQKHEDNASKLTVSDGIKEISNVTENVSEKTQSQTISVLQDVPSQKSDASNCDSEVSDKSDDIPFDSNATAPVKEETVIASSENSKIVKNSSSSDDLDVLISAFEHTVKNTVTSTARPNASKYADELKRILKKEEFVSDVVPKAVSINTERISENTKITVSDNSVLIEDVFNYLDLIKAKADELVLKRSNKNSGPVNDAKSHIELISAVVSDINSINSDAMDDAPSKSVLSAISKLPSYDENGNIVTADNLDSPSDFRLESKQEPISADELLAKAQETARAQLLLDQNLNEKLLAEGRAINAKANLTEIINSSDPEKNDVTLSDNADVLIEDNIEELKKTASCGNDSVCNETVCEISQPVPDLINSLQDNAALADDRELTSLQDALNIELNKKVNVSSYSVSDGKSYSDALIQAVNISLSGKFGTNRNVVEGIVNKSNGHEESEAKVVPSVEKTSAPSVIIPDVESESFQGNLSSAKVTEVHTEKGTVQVVNPAMAVPLQNSSLSTGSGSAFPVRDGNPKVLKSSTLKIIEEDQQFENRRLGRKLETNDFYPKVLETSQWLKTIRNAGYTDGPMYSTLCYANRRINPNDEFDWTLEISSDFEFLTKAPEFLHNLQTKFSILMNHPVKLSVNIVKGVPFECPEDLARKWYLKELENSRIKIRENVVLNRLLTNLGEDVNTINLTLYTQEDN